MGEIIPVRVRWADLDVQGHVNNAVVVDLLQEARVRLLLSGTNAHLLGQGVIVVGHRVEYLAPIAYEPEPVAVHVRVGRLGASRFTYDYEIYQRDALVVRAQSDACVFDFEVGRPRRMTEAERAWFRSIEEPIADFRDVGRFTLTSGTFDYPFPVRWSDLDSYGHVNNVNFLTYIGEARVALARQLAPDSIMTSLASSSPGMLLIVRQDIAYVAQMQHQLADYVIRTAVARVGRTSVTFVHDIVDEQGTVYARATAVLVHADFDGKPVAVAPSIREAALRWPALSK